MKSYQEFNESFKKYLIKRKDVDKIIKSWIEYYGDEQKALDEFSDYDGGVEQLYSNGGELYRVVFVDSVDEVKLNPEEIGNCWTISEWDICNIVDTNWFYFGKDKKMAIVMKVKTPSHNISCYGIDIAGNAYEKEVSVLDKNKLELIGLYDYSVYPHKRLL